MTETEKQSALESIALIKNLVDRSHREITHGGSGWICIIWGFYALLGYAGSHLFHHWHSPALAGWWWPFLMLFGFAASIIVIRRKAATRSARLKGSLTGWFMLFWIPLILLMAALIALCLLLPDLPIKYITPFVLLVVSAGYLMIGLMFHKSLLVMGFLGLAGTFVTTVFFIEQAGPILSLLFGLGLIVTGLLLNRRR